MICNRMGIFNGSRDRDGILYNNLSKKYKLDIININDYWNDKLCFESNKTNYNIIWFDFNEEKITDRDLSILYSIENDLIDKFPKSLLIYQPSKLIKSSNKYTFHKLLSDNSEIKSFIPKTQLVTELDFDKINIKLPFIIRSYQQCCGANTFLIEDKTKFDKIKKTINFDKYIITEYLESKYDMLPNLFINARFLVVNDKLYKILPRISENWCAHNADNYISNMSNDTIQKNLMILNDHLKYKYEEQISQFNKLFKVIYDIVGNGIYAYDFIINQNNFILCEICAKPVEFTLYKAYKDIFGEKLYNDISGMNSSKFFQEIFSILFQK